MQCPSCGGNVNKCGCAGSGRARAGEAPAAPPGDDRPVTSGSARNGADGFRQFIQDLLQFLRDFSSARTVPGSRELPVGALSPSEEPQSAGQSTAAAPAFRVPPYTAVMKEQVADGPGPEDGRPSGGGPGEGHPGDGRPAEIAPTRRGRSGRAKSSSPARP